MRGASVISAAPLLLPRIDDDDDEEEEGDDDDKPFTNPPLVLKLFNFTC